MEGIANGSLGSNFVAQQFVDLSHDMRTPLSVILSAVQVLEQKDEQLEPELAQIRRNAQQLLRIVGNFVDFATIEAGRLHMHMQSVEAIAWLKEVGMACAPFAKQKGIEFLYISNLSEIWIYCDPVRLERCVLNLVSNAVRFTEPGGLICLSIERVGDEVCISVSDNGKGMEKKYVAGLFHRFSTFGLDTQMHTGNGLGLSLVKSYIEHMRGRIEIESEHGEGTRASLFLPIRKAIKRKTVTVEVLAQSMVNVAVEFADVFPVE